MPIPLSITWIQANEPGLEAWGTRLGSSKSPLTSGIDPSTDKRISTLPSFGVNLIALESKFQIICCRRSGSPQTICAFSSSKVSSSIALASAWGRTVSSTILINSIALTGCIHNRSLPRMILEISRRSSISCACERALRAIVSKARRVLDWSNFLVSNSCDHPNIELSGVRSSWETIAKNSSFIRLAASASARAACSRIICSRTTSASLRSVISSIVPTWPNDCLCGESIVEVATWTQRKPPSGA